MQIASLGSGSKGNATLVRCGDMHVVVDCGFSLKQFETRLQRLDLSPNNIDAILVTHEHSDHGAGVARLAQRFDIPLWATVGTARALGIDQFEAISGGQVFTLGQQLRVEAVTVPHDAAEPVQYVFTSLHEHSRLGLLTDTGHITSHMKTAYRDLHGLLLEFNYDQDMLRNGPYPPSLQQRIAGGFGHLSNEQSIAMLQQINIEQMRCLVAAHLSEKNNSPDIVQALLDDQPLNCAVELACQQQGFAWIEV